MNPLKQKYYVCHPKFSPEQLNDKTLAKQVGGTFQPGFRLRVEGPIQDDGKYILIKNCTRPIDMGQGKEGLIDFHEESLDQASVDRIEDAKADARTRLSGCDYVLLEVAK